MEDQKWQNDLLKYATENSLTYPDGVIKTLLKYAPPACLSEWKSNRISNVEQAWNTLQMLNSIEKKLSSFNSNASALIISMFNSSAKEYIEKASAEELALAYLMLTYEDIPKTDIIAEGVKVSVPNIFCDIFKSNVNGDLYDDEVANYVECEFEQDVKTIHTEPEITGLVVGESIVDEFRVKRYGML